MPKRANAMFHDVELLVTLPNVWTLFHIDDDKAPWAPGWTGTKVDWAWEERGAFYLCELKDPECAGAVAHPTTPSHVKATVDKLTGTAFPNEFAENARDTIDNHPAVKAATNVRLIVVAAISDPSFTSAVALPAGDLIERHLARMGLSIPVVVLNIAEWNAQLAPRTLQRSP